MRNSVRLIVIPSLLAASLLGGCGNDQGDLVVTSTQPSMTEERRATGGEFTPDFVLRTVPQAPPASMRPDTALVLAQTSANTTSSVLLPAHTIPPIQNQEKLDSCGGFAIGYGLGSWAAGSAHGESPDGQGKWVSPAFSYSRALGLEGDTSCSGTTALSYLEPMVRTGAVSWNADPYPADGSQATMCSALQSYTGFSPTMEFGLGSYAQLPVSDLDGLKEYLATGTPFAGLFQDYTDMHTVTNNVYTASGSPLGGHFLFVVGYDDTIAYTDKNGNPAQGAFWVHNSWGKSYGQDGYFWMAYEAFSATCKEAWLGFPNKPPAASGTDVQLQASQGAPAGRVSSISQQLDPATGQYFTVFGLTFDDAVHITSHSVQGPDGNTVQVADKSQWFRTGTLHFQTTSPLPAGSYNLTVQSTASGASWTATVSLPGV